MLSQKLSPARARALVALAALPLASIVAGAQSPDDGRQCSRIVATPPEPRAMAHAERVIAGAPDGAMAAFYRGCLTWAERGAGKAAGQFEAAAKLVPDNATIHDWIGRAYGEQIRRANPIRQAMLAGRVRDNFELAVRLDPENLDARAYLAQYYFSAPRIGGGSAEKGWEQIEEIRRRDPYRGGMMAAERRLKERSPAAAALEYETLARQYPDSSAPRVAQSGHD